MTLQNKVAIITGASRGIGRAIAEAFVSEGAKVVLNGTNEVLLQDVCSSLNKEETRAVSVVGDASLPATAASLVEKAKTISDRLIYWSTMLESICGNQQSIHLLMNGKD